MPERFNSGDLFAGIILVALYLVMLAGIAFAMPLQKLIRRFQ